MTEENNQVHKRRIHYSGTHPKRFEEKYKEHNPEKYKDTIAHVISKGNTPAGMHISIMADEILSFLDIKPGQKGLDATLGYGGHTRRMLEKLEGKGHIWGLDVDTVESAKTKERLLEAGFGDDLFTLKVTNFRYLRDVAAEVGPFDFILADLGVSSMQIDDPKRGFSYKVDGPLDLRLDQTSGISAAQRIERISAEELAGMLMENADEPYAWEIAREVVKRHRKGKKIKTTLQMKDAIYEALSFIPEKERDEAVKKSCARVFQALRIDVNHEYEVLYDFLDALPDALKSGGRAAILTFHSGEDRLVKKALKNFKRAGLFSEINDDVIRPSAAECRLNPRAHSTKMRYCIKA